MHPLFASANDEEYRRQFAPSQSEIENRFHLNRDITRPCAGVVGLSAKAGNCNET
jgi:hypothetical protein